MSNQGKQWKSGGKQPLQAWKQPHDSPSVDKYEGDTDQTALEAHRRHLRAPEVDLRAVLEGPPMAERGHIVAAAHPAHTVFVQARRRAHPMILAWW
jgi:hypothetical protein